MSLKRAPIRLSVYHSSAHIEAFILLYSSQINIQPNQTKYEYVNCIRFKGGSDWWGDGVLCIRHSIPHSNILWKSSLMEICYTIEYNQLQITTNIETGLTPNIAVEFLCFTD